MNFSHDDQIGRGGIRRIIRQSGWVGSDSRFIRASSGVRLALRLLQLTQARTQFPQLNLPPRLRGRM
jgi:hypothetical protein